MSVFKLKGFDEPISNENIVAIQGVTNLVSADTQQVLSQIPGGKPNFPPVAGEQISLVSASVADAGVDVLVIGLSPGDLLYQEELVTLNGTTPVQTTLEFSRVNFLRWRTAAAGPAADVTASGSNGAYRVLNSFTSFDNTAVYSTPADKKWTSVNYLVGIRRDSALNSSVTSDIWIKPALDEDAAFSAFTVPVNTSGTSTLVYDNPITPLLELPTDIYITGNPSAANVEASGRFVIRFEQK